jgi:hypothetical protein
MLTFLALFVIYSFDILKDDNEGDEDNSHEFYVVGTEGESNAAHNKWRTYHVSISTILQLIKNNSIGL